MILLIRIGDVSIMKKEQIIIELEDEFTVDFVKNERGFGKAICRIEGIVSFIDDSCTQFIHPGSSWIVQVKVIKPKTLIVLPLVKVHTAKENFALVESKLEELKKVPEKKVKTKKTFIYKSRQELNQELYGRN